MNLEFKDERFFFEIEKMYEKRDYSIRDTVENFLQKFNLDLKSTLIKKYRSNVVLRKLIF